jgi:endonuclease YncB( thermonuclease family)
MCKTLPKLIALLIVFSECLIVCFCLHSQISTKASTPLQQQASRSLNSEERRLPLCFSRKALIDASVTAGLNLLLAGAVTSPAHAIPFFNARFDTADDVPKDYFDRHRSIYAFCERVIDGDTIRVRHIPGYSVFGAFQASELEPLSSRGIADKTLILRLYGVDTPEVAKPSNGNTGQPFSQQAKEYTADLVYQRVVKVTFLKKDQYRRAVSQVETLPKFRFLSFLPGFGSRDVSIELAAAGLAELYTGGGAEYNVSRLDSPLLVSVPCGAPF